MEQRQPWPMSWFFVALMVFSSVALATTGVFAWSLVLSWQLPGVDGGLGPEQHFRHALGGVMYPPAKLAMVTLLFDVFLLVILYLRCTRTHKLYSYPRGELAVLVAIALLAAPAPVISTVNAVHHGRQMQNAFVPDRVRNALQDPPPSLAPHADHAADHEGHPVMEIHDPVRDRRSAMTQRWVGTGDAGAVCSDVERLVESMTHADVERMSSHASVGNEEADACHLRSRLAPYVWTDATVELTSLASPEFSQVLIVSINVLAPTSDTNEIPPR